ncbi:MAG TPA: DNA polymerase IV [Candidatus Paceibacterota bacterium]|nr:DNA polymerase IV [Candidatus Paceibacterota bacterium]
MRYILHCDGDNFFASCLVAKYPRLRNKPLVVGAERGMATALSVEAKALGVTRGMPIFEIKAKYPEVIILSGDYELFSRTSIRMHRLIEATTTAVEKYSIDESFADITEAIEKRRSSAEIIGIEIKERTWKQLGIPISFGVAPTKTLAKLVSTSSKPNGFRVAMTEETLTPILANIPIEKVWGIGWRTAVKLRARGIQTALELRDIPPNVLSTFARPLLDIQKELRGIIVHPINLEHAPLQSMISSLSFPATTDSDFIHREFIRHIEHLAHRLRKHGLAARTLTIHTKNSKQEVIDLSCTLPQHSNTPGIFIDHFEMLFPHILKLGERIRTTGAAVTDLIPETAANISLFDKRDAREEVIFKTVDSLHKRGLSVRSGIGI